LRHPCGGVVDKEDQESSQQWKLKNQITVRLAQKHRGTYTVKRSLLILVCAVALVAAACGAKSSSNNSASENEGGSTKTTAAAGTDAAMWGDLKSPCGKGSASVAPGEGPSTDTLFLGVANDRNSEIRPGLNKEFWDAAVAYTDWCNAQGGIQGVPLSPVDIDGGVVNVEAGMTKACNAVFALVGGGFALDNLEFSGKDGSDFHKCGLIDIPGFTVSVEKSLSNGQVQPLPNPANAKSSQWITDFKKLYPEDSKKIVVVYSKDLPSLEAVKVQFDSVVAAEGGIQNLPPVAYPIVVTDWGPYAEKIIASGATSMYWIGEPANAANLLKVLQEKGWKGTFLNEANLYDNLFTETGGAASEGAIVRTATHPFEEAAKWPGVQQYLDNLKKYVPDGKAAFLGLQGTSSWLLFSVAANTCAQKNKGVIDRQCVLTEANAIDNWTAGGMHAPSDPGTKVPVSCGMLLVVKNGKFERLYPKLGGEGDDGDGFHCPADSIVTVPPASIVGTGNVDPSRPPL